MNVPAEVWGSERPGEFLAYLVERMCWCRICGWGDSDFIWNPPPLWHECDTSNFVEKVGIRG